MKTKITIWTLSFILLNSSSWAQPIVTGAIQPPIGSRTCGYVIPGSITHGSTGASQIWDYSAIVHDTSTYYFEHIAFSSLPAPEQAAFPTGNEASSYVLGGTEVARLVFQLDANQLLYLGLNGSAFPVPVTFFTFPQNYMETNVAGLSYDAYGTLTTPFGSWNDVIRLKAISGGNYKYDYYQFDPNYILLMEYLEDTNTLAISGQTFFNTPSLSGVNDEAMLAENINIYPNPSSGVFQIKTEEIQLTKVEIYNVMGEKIYASSKSLGVNPTFDISSHPKGIYFVKIHNGINSVTEKILVE